MIVEVAILKIKQGQSIQFEADFKKASLYIASIDGYLEHTLQKCLEKENQYLLLVKWKKLEDHTIGFRESAAYENWKQLLHHYYEPFPVVEHYEEVFRNKESSL